MHGMPRLLQTRASAGRARPVGMSSDSADAGFQSSIREAALVRPVQAAEGPEAAAVAAARYRFGDGHWVQQLHRISSTRADTIPAVRVDPMQRRSSFAPGSTPQIGSVLGVLATMSVVREEGVDDVGRSWSSRVSPSAGGTHSIRPLLWIGGENGGWFRSGIDGSTEEVEVPVRGELLADAAAALHVAPDSVPAVLFAVAEPDVLLARYPLGVSLLWRDAGAFCVSVQYVAQSYGLGSRILGIARELDVRERRVPASLVGAAALSEREVFS